MKTAAKAKAGSKAGSLYIDIFKIDVLARKGNNKYI